MNNFFKKVFICFLVVATMLPVLPTNAASLAQASGDASYALLQDIINIYLETSLYETDRETLINDMLYNYLQQNPYLIGPLANALLSSNDPYSSYYSANLGFMSNTSKSYGIIISDSSVFENPGLKDGVYISEVIPGSNAEFAGIRAGDRFVSLEGINVEGLTVSGITKLLSFLPFAPKPAEN
jgi:C-terminal processing protease CtpA/Prc